MRGFSSISRDDICVMSLLVQQLQYLVVVIVSLCACVKGTGKKCGDACSEWTECDQYSSCGDCIYGECQRWPSPAELANGQPAEGGMSDPGTS